MTGDADRDKLGQTLGQGVAVLVVGHFERPLSAHGSRVLLGAGSERQLALQPIETIDHRWARFVMPTHAMVCLAA